MIPRVHAAAGALFDEGKAEIGIRRAVRQFQVGVHLNRVAGERPHGVVFHGIDILAQPAGTEEQVGQKLLLNFHAVVAGAQSGEVGLDVVVFVPIVDRLIGDPRILIVAIGDAIDEWINLVVHHRRRIRQGRRTPLAIVDVEPWVGPGSPAQGIGVTCGIRYRCRNGRVDLNRSNDFRVPLEVGDARAALDQTHGPRDVFKQDAALPLRIANSIRDRGGEEVTAGRSRADDFTRDITIGERGVNVGPVGCAGVEDRDHARDRVISGAARCEPWGYLIARGEGVGPVGIVLVVFRECPNDRVLERLEGDRTVLAAREFAGRLALELFVVIEQRRVNRQLVGNQGPVEGEDSPVGAVLVHTHRDLVGILIEHRLGGGLVDDTGRGTESKEQRIRATGDFDRLGVVGVEWHPVIRREVIDRGIGSTEAADAVRLGIGDRAATRIGVAAEGILGRAAVDEYGRVGAGSLRARLIPEDVIDIA